MFLGSARERYHQQACESDPRSQPSWLGSYGRRRVRPLLRQTCPTSRSSLPEQLLPLLQGTMSQQERTVDQGLLQGLRS